MPTPTFVRLSLPLFFTLGTFLTALPAPANPPGAQTAETHELPLNHTTPAALVQQMHWDKNHDYPDGVTQIRADTKNNALAVVATPAGFASLQELVKLLDFTPRRVRLQFVLARAVTSDLQASGLHGFSLVPITRLGAANTATSGFLGMASGSVAVQLLKTLTRHKTVLQAPVLTTTNNADAALRVSGSSLPTGWSTFTFAATPRVNSDNSVTLRLHPSLSKRSVKQEIQTLRTVQSGDMIVLIDLFPQAANAKNGSLVLFVTPKILPQ